MGRDLGLETGNWDTPMYNADSSTYIQLYLTRAQEPVQFQASDSRPFFRCVSL
jgi:hypothetical protein